MNECLSSSLTLINKFFALVIWLGGGCFILLINPRFDLFFLLLFLIITAFIYWSCCRLKKVERFDNLLRISNYFREIEVPLTEVESVSGNIFMRPELIWLTFRRPTMFGSKIVFMPRWRVLSGWTRNPLVAQLQEEIVQLRGSAG
jgi:hypothetical protein